MLIIVISESFQYCFDQGEQHLLHICSLHPLEKKCGQLSVLVWIYKYT